MDARRTTVMTFRPSEAATLTGLTPWQLAHWRDIVDPSWRSGAYNFRDLVALRALARLKDKHSIPTRQLRRAVKLIRERTDDSLSSVRIGVGPKNKLAFFVDGAWEAADGTGQIVAEIALDHVMDQLRKDVKKSRTRPRSQWGATEKTVGVCGNRERFAGTRVAVGLVVEMVKTGATATDLRREFPTLTGPDFALAKKLAATG